MPEPIVGLHHVTAIASGPQRRSAAEMIKLGNEIGLPGIALLAPQAPEHTWYLNSFLVPPFRRTSLGLLQRCIRCKISWSNALQRHPGYLDGTMVLLSSGDPDPHVPWTRVEETAQQLRSMGASVYADRFPGRPHTVLPKELNAARSLLGSAFAKERVDSNSRTAEK